MKNLIKTTVQTSVLTLVMFCLTLSFANCQLAMIGGGHDFYSDIDHYPSWDEYTLYSLESPTDNVALENDASKEILSELEMAIIALEIAKTEALKFYNQSNWKQARKSLIKFLDQVSDDDSNSLHFKYLYSQTCYNMGDYARAIEVLDDLMQEDQLDNAMRHDVEFDLALITLMINEKSSLRQFSLIAADNSSPYQSDAKTLIERF